MCECQCQCHTAAVTSQPPKPPTKPPLYRALDDPPKPTVNYRARNADPSYYLGWEFETSFKLDAYYQNLHNIDFRPVDDLRLRFIAPRWKEFGHAEKFGKEKQPGLAYSKDGSWRVYICFNSSEEMKTLGNRELIEAAKHVLDIKEEPRWIRLVRKKRRLDFKF